MITQSARCCLCAGRKKVQSWLCKLETKNGAHHTTLQFVKISPQRGSECGLA